MPLLKHICVYFETVKSLLTKTGFCYLNSKNAYLFILIISLCSSVVYWLAIMALYLPMARRAVGRPLPSQEGLSVTVIEALFLAPCPTCMNASARSAQQHLNVFQIVIVSLCFPDSFFYQSKVLLDCEDWPHKLYINAQV